MNKYVYIDFEYNSSNHENVNVVCAAWQFYDGKDKSHVISQWLYRDKEAQADFLHKVWQWKEDGYIFVSYSWGAEVRSFLSLGAQDVALWKAVDLYLEYRMLLNNNNEFAYGRQLLKGKRVFTYPPPRWAEEDDEDNHAMPEYNLAACAYKLLGAEIDTVEKDVMRQRIIRGGSFSEVDRQNIMKYCLSDIEHLHAIHMEMNKVLKNMLKNGLDSFKESEFFKQQHLRAEYAARTAVMESHGYPVNVQRLHNLSDRIPYILAETQRDINKKTHEALGFKMFVWDRKTQQFKKQEKLLKEWVDSTYGKSWPLRTKTGPSLKEEVLEKITSSRHEFNDDPIDQYLRFTKLVQSLNGFKPVRESNKKNMWDSLGPDGRMRPFFGIYGAQSSRSQPSATSYIMLKSAVFRGLIEPPQGKMIIGSDYGSQEFYVAALLSGDKRMIAAYLSGDPYMSFAIDARLAPVGATKDTHKDIRNKCKSTVLGVSYGLTAPGLAMKLTNDTKIPHTVAEAERLIELFFSTYNKYADWREEFLHEYKQRKLMQLPDGWTMFGDNDNFRSVLNCPIQGISACVMRLAVALMQDRGLHPIMTLHDAIYCEEELGDWEKVDEMVWCMDEAFKEYLGRKSTIMQDVYAWGRGITTLSETEVKAKVPWEEGIWWEKTTPKGVTLTTMEEYVDDRVTRQLAKFTSYWEDSILL